MTSGDKIRRERRNQDLTQARLSRIVGTVPSTICDIERGQKAPSWPLVQKIAKALNVTLDSLKDD